MAKKKAALISGGGSWGAYGGGTLQKINGNYDTVIGVSTGSLMSPYTALQEWEMLKLAYTSINNENVFDKKWYKPYPLTKKGKLKKLPIIITLILGQNSIATSKNLRKEIDRYFPESFFNDLKKSNKEVLVGSQNYAEIPSKIHYFSSNEENFEDFKDWMWCSANFPFYTSLVKKGWRDFEGNFHIGYWSDGGLTDLIGLEQLNGYDYKEIDIVLHRTLPEKKFEGNKVCNLMDNVTTSINAMRYEIEFEYFRKRIAELNKEGAKITVYWLPRKLSANSMVFNQKEMSEWWEEGFNTAFDENRVEIFEPTNI
jgi:predicted patatin/cPLA2 family phospholipase